MPPNPSERDDVTPDVQPTTTHSWLQSNDESDPWARPPTGPPPPPARPPRADAATQPTPPAVSVPAPLPPAAAPSRPPSGYDAPAPDTRWHTYLQRGEPPTPASAATRAPATVAGVLLFVGAALAVVGSVLTWGTFPDEVVALGLPRTFNGFTELAGESKDGPFFVGFAVILAAFGITLLLAKRITALLIIGAILAGFGAVAAVIDLLDVADPDGVPAAMQPSVGVGLPVVIGGFVLAFAGSLIGLLRGTRSR